MLAFLLPLASKVISDAVAKIPENEELGEKLVEICLVILGKAVKLDQDGYGRSIAGSCQESNGRQRRRVIPDFL